MQIEFTTEELAVLSEVLRHKIDEADVEVFRTDTHDFKEMLKHRRELLGRILTKVSPAALAT